MSPIPELQAEPDRFSPVKTLNEVETQPPGIPRRVSGRADGGRHTRRPKRRAGPVSHVQAVDAVRYFSAPAVSPATTCRWKMMYAASTGSIAITRPAKSPDQSPL